jgi:hypothetical protein
MSFCFFRNIHSTHYNVIFLKILQVAHCFLTKVLFKVVYTTAYQRGEKVGIEIVKKKHLCVMIIVLIHGCYFEARKSRWSSMIMSEGEFSFCKTSWNIFKHAVQKNLCGLPRYQPLRKPRSYFEQ